MIVETKKKKTTSLELFVNETHCRAYYNSRPNKQFSENLKIDRATLSKKKHDLTKCCIEKSDFL